MTKIERMVSLEHESDLLEQALRKLDLSPIHAPCCRAVLTARLRLVRKLLESLQHEG